MYQTSLYFKIKDTSALEKHKILEIFFKSWIDDTCNNEVVYNLVPISNPNPHQFEELYRVDFEKIEDAVAIKLKGIPDEFCHYIEIII